MRSPPSAKTIVILGALAVALGVGGVTGPAASQETTILERDGKMFVAADGRLFEVVPDVVTVKFRRGTDQSTKVAIVSSLGSAIIRENRLGFVDLRVPLDKSAVEFVAELEAIVAVEIAEVNAIGEYQLTPNDPRFPEQWALNNTGQAGGIAGSDIDAPGAWDLETGDPSVIVAVLDSGTDIDHEDLTCNVYVNPGEDLDEDGVVWDLDDMNGIDDDGNGFVDDLVGWDFGNGNNDPRGPVTHGTLVAGVIGACGQNATGITGVAGGIPSPGSRLMTLGVGDTLPVSTVLDDAVLYATDMGAHVINFSLSGPPSAAFDAALTAAWDAGVFIASSSGKDHGPVSYPARHPDVMAVGATAPDDRLLFSSNFGPELEVVAPGFQILSTVSSDAYGKFDGTSFASPHVAGVAALLLSRDPSLTNAQVRSCIQASAEDEVGDPAEDVPGRDDFYGFGRLNARAALECGDNPPDIPPPGENVAMVADAGTSTFTIFDSDVDEAIGSVAIPSGPGSVIGDCSIMSDQSRGFATNFENEVWVVNPRELSLFSPELPQSNPIVISNSGHDTSLAEFDRNLVVCDGNRPEPLSVIDPRTLTELSTFDTGGNCSSVDVCNDGSVLLTSGNEVRRLVFGIFNQLIDLGEVLEGLGAENVFCSPDGNSGVVFTRNNQIQSFTIPGLVPVDTRDLSGTGVSGFVDAARGRVYVRSNAILAGELSFVEVFGFSSVTGDLTPDPIFSIPIAETQQFSGIDQMAMHPDGSRLYVSQPEAVEIFDPDSGAPLGSITFPDIVAPTGICFPTNQCAPVTTLKVSSGAIPLGTLGGVTVTTSNDLLLSILQLGVRFDPTELQAISVSSPTLPNLSFSIDNVGGIVNTRTTGDTLTVLNAQEELFTVEFLNAGIPPDGTSAITLSDPNVFSSCNHLLGRASFGPLTRLPFDQVEGLVTGSISEAITLQAGRPDGFETEDGPELADPSLALIEWLDRVEALVPGANVFPLMDFDEPIFAANRVFGHTFSGLPRGPYRSAVLEIGIRPNDVPAVENDFIELRFTGDGGEPLGPTWFRRIGDCRFTESQCAGQQPGLLEQLGLDPTWSPDIYPDGHVFALDLGALKLEDASTTSLLPSLEENQLLDVVVADDTSVDFIRLRITRGQASATAAPFGCGLGFELAFLLPPLMRLRKKRRA